mgnify:CR=1 FL=1
MKVTKDHILAALPRLSMTDLRDINAVSARLLEPHAALDTPKRTDDPHMWVFEAVKNTVGTGQTSGPKHFHAKATEFLKFVDENFPKALKNRASGSSVILMLVQLIADDMKQRGVPRSMGTLTLHLSRVTEVFDDAFPGYRQAKLAHLLYKP